MNTKIYDVLDGVTHVNAEAVPDSRKVSLTDAQARYDLDHGRISLAPAATPVSVPADAPAPMPAGKNAQTKPSAS